MNVLILLLSQSLGCNYHILYLFLCSYILSPTLFVEFVVSFVVCRRGHNILQSVGMCIKCDLHVRTLS